MELDRLATVLASRLAMIVPAGFHVAAADGLLRYTAEEGRFPGQLGDYHVGESGTYVHRNWGVFGVSDEENIVGIAIRALDDLQDHVSEATHDPWPGTTSQPTPHAEILGGRLELWYGDHDDPFLACEPIPLADLGLRR